MASITRTAHRRTRPSATQRRAPGWASSRTRLRRRRPADASSAPPTLTPVGSVAPAARATTATSTRECGMASGQLDADLLGETPRRLETGRGQPHRQLADRAGQPQRSLSSFLEQLVGRVQRGQPGAGVLGQAMSPRRHRILTGQRAQSRPRLIDHLEPGRSASSQGRDRPTASATRHRPGSPPSSTRAASSPSFGSTEACASNVRRACRSAGSRQARHRHPPAAARKACAASAAAVRRPSAARGAAPRRATLVLAGCGSTG